jgi:predicted site-specific integrase-resolvase
VVDTTSRALYILVVRSTLLTTRQVAERLQITPNGVHHWIKVGVLHPIRPHDRGNMRFRPDEVETLASKLGIETDGAA